MPINATFNNELFAQIWHQPLTAVVPLAALEGEDYTVINFLLLVFTLVTGSMFLSSAAHVAPATAQKLPAAERGDKTIGLVPGLVQLIPFCSVLVMSFLLATGPGAATFAAHPGLQLFGMGVTTTHICSRMVRVLDGWSALVLSVLSCVVWRCCHRHDDV